MSVLPDLTETHDFTELLPHTREELLRDLVDTATILANLSQHIGYLRAEEVRDPHNPIPKAERLEWEQVRMGYDEKKWVIIRLLDIGK